MVAHLDAEAPEHQEPEHHHQGEIETAEAGGIEQREGEVECPARGEKPDLISIPHRPDGPKVAIVNERFAAMAWPGQDPVGRQLADDLQLRTIPAVVIDGVLLNAALWAPSLARVLDTSLRYTVDKTTREILGFFRALVEKEKITLLMVSHDPLVDGYAHTLVHLADGQVVDAVRLEKAGRLFQRRVRRCQEEWVILRAADATAAVAPDDRVAADAATAVAPDDGVAADATAGEQERFAEQAEAMADGIEREMGLRSYIEGGVPLAGAVRSSTTRVESGLPQTRMSWSAARTGSRRPRWPT